MKTKIKYYSNGEKKKEAVPIKKGGKPFYLITNFDSDGLIKSVMEKPDFSQIPLEKHISGAHIFTDPRFNHYDHFDSGKVWKEQIPQNATLPYEISGNILIC